MNLWKLMGKKFEIKRNIFLLSSNKGHQNFAQIVYYRFQNFVFFLYRYRNIFGKWILVISHNLSRMNTRRHYSADQCSEFNLSNISTTKNSVNSIVTNLSLSLRKHDVSYTDVNPTKIQSFIRALGFNLL